MTVKELRKILEKAEKDGFGDAKICVVSRDCEPISDFDEKFTTEINPYMDLMDNTFTICN